jgi:hypothetical protein
VALAGRVLFPTFALLAMVRPPPAPGGKLCATDIWVKANRDKTTTAAEYKTWVLNGLKVASFATQVPCKMPSCSFVAEIDNGFSATNPFVYEKYGCGSDNRQVRQTNTRLLEFAGRELQLDSPPSRALHSYSPPMTAIL